MRALLIALVLALALPARLAASDGAWDALRAGGAVALVRHARAPGTGDPPGMRLDDCSTQRVLSEGGREQARALGRRLRAAGIEGVQVRSSAWCRTRETAELLGLGPVTHLQPLDSFFENRRAASDQTAALRAFLDAGKQGPPRILVTHQVNITALVGVFPAEAELIVLLPEPDGYQVAARIRQD